MWASDDPAQNCTGTVTELDFVPKFGTLYPECFLAHCTTQSCKAWSLRSSLPPAWPCQMFGPKEVEPDSEGQLGWKETLPGSPGRQSPGEGQGLPQPRAPDRWVRTGREAGLVGGCLPPSCLTSPLFSLLPVFLFCSLLEGKGGAESKWRQLFPRPWGGLQGPAINQ